MIDSYDEVPYPGYAYPQTHPDRLATIATLFGMNPPPVERCRVLDIGCGDGANLIPMAFGLPAGEFAGIDPAGTAIRRGEEMIAALGLRNVALHRLDLRELDASFGRFDYIVAYGLYSWVPPEVRDSVLSVISERLADNGVAYVNYNAYPGGYVRSMMRDMLLDRLRGIEGARARMEAAREFLRVLAAAGEGEEEWSVFLGRQAQRLLERRAEITYHDELATHYAPAWFRDFVAHAARHGLQYLGEAHFSDMSAGGLSKTAAASIDSIEGVVEREQYMDYLKCRRFRQTLLCRAGIALDRELKPERCADLWASSPLEPAAAADGSQEFRHPEGRSLTTAHPLAKSVMLRLAEAWPEPVRFDDVPERVALGTILLRACQGAMVELHVWPPRPARTAGERPLASPVARYQLGRGEVVAATLVHTRIDVSGERERRLVLLLDGTRDRAGIAGELGVSADEVDRALMKLARLGLLLA